MRGTLPATLIFLATAAHSAVAQTALTPGEAIRITANGERFEGQLVTWSRDSLVARYGTVNRVIKRADLLGLEHQEGRKNAWVRGAEIGATALGITGAVAGALASCTDSPFFPCPDPASRVMGAGLAGAVVGGLIGSIVGAFFRTPAWRRISTDPAVPALTLQLAPQAAALRIRVVSWR